MFCSEKIARRANCHSMLLPLMAITVAACGYRSDLPPDELRIVAIPFVHGDRNGHLTQALAQQALYAGFELDHGADLVLDVDVAPFDSIDVGRIFQRCQDGCLTEIAVPNEGRMSGSAIVRLRTRSGHTVLGPLHVKVDQHYDFQSDLSQINTFRQHGERLSLLRYGRGQLDYYAAAQDGCAQLLEDRLAQRIIEAITGAQGMVHLEYYAD